MAEEQEEPLERPNPTVYRSRCIVRLALAVIYALLFAVKIGILILNEPYGDFSLRSPQDSQKSYFEHLLFYLFCFDCILNLWMVSWIVRPIQKEKIKKITICAEFYDWSFYFFLLDVLIVTLCPLAWDLPGNKYRILTILVVFVLIPCGLAYFFLVNSCHILSYDPNFNCSKLSFEKEYVEFEYSPRIWSIKETGAFRLVLLNSGAEKVPAGSKFTVERQVRWQGIHGNGGTVAFSSAVIFSIKLGKEVEFGQSLVLIPETHTEPGAVQVPGYRSFGNAKGNSVVTSVYSSREQLLIKLIQNYKSTEKEMPPVRSAGFYTA